MKQFDTYSDLPSDVKGNVVVIGNFDGLHKGHQAILKTARSKAEDLQCDLIVLTFDPHPRQVFAPDTPGFRLSDKILKADALENHGVDCVISLTFDHAFSQKTAEAFIKDVLVDGLAAKHIVVGDDFIFGYQRGGNIDTLKTNDHFDITAHGQILNESQAVYGSSLIRQAIRRGDMLTAANHLGYPWVMRSTVIHGDKRGREMGWPTANMRMDDFIHPAYGIYAVRVTCEDGQTHNGVANFGVRPMFAVKEPLLEAHLFDFNGDLYNQILQIEFIRYLRGEMKFDSLEALIEQIEKDAANAKKVLLNI